MQTIVSTISRAICWLWLLAISLSLGMGSSGCTPKPKNYRTVKFKQTTTKTTKKKTVRHSGTDSFW